MIVSSSIVFDIFNYIGIVAFAISGAIKAVKKGMDLLGVLVLGFSTALGGGIISNLLLGKTPPTNLIYYPYPITAFLASLATFVFYRIFTNVGKPLLYADAIGLGAFASSGASLAYSVSNNVILVVIVGAITAVGGGVIRDILSNEVPLILTREFYATTAVIGSFVYFIASDLSVPEDVALIVSFLITLILRILAMELKWELPRKKIE
ncbi:trimeric intracellular cation channel family protein [Sulfolobus acidocaldarius]|uniref:Membrane protein n=4 Tax=Sulfolobus acidocaldarius TaxID=2285 RepID=Q4J9E6_SULAC|nr:trimeric intracellular cation channel family protein [Sulfolobus acidocaldarius]AAY80584.1 membrane protein [Sulfolobus acidocaldarius DSM 639]AGE71174.1 membrane protein [Sulfolobus acidocaldarius N8]AGE73444.1 membrane protein [Sulfolobus acidocaldarius Ron12/I]ALU28558.1 hypothetical protein ATY89_00310 [Sulfolobus acidocaldarius]ALU31270.1 hypothetical protein ATZ20_03355 [Sulfolobus acidocaldarius]